MSLSIAGLSQLFALITQGWAVGIPIFALLKDAAEKIRLALQERGYEQDTSALQAAAAEDDVIIARARAEQESTE